MKPQVDAHLRVQRFLLFGPAGVEGFLREGSKPARARTLPPTEEEFLDKESLMAIAEGYGQEVVGPAPATQELNLIAVNGDVAFVRMTDRTVVT